MDLQTFIIFIMLQFFLVIIGIWKRGAIFSLIGLLTTIFVIPVVLATGLEISRVYTVNPLTGEVLTHITYADPTLLVLIFFIIFIIHFLCIIRSAR